MDERDILLQQVQEKLDAVLHELQKLQANQFQLIQMVEDHERRLRSAEIQVWSIGRL